jgi:threonine dehydratase
VTHSSGNHAQALALAASTFNVPAYIVMPSISTPSKIAGTKLYTDHVIFSGSTSQEREAVVAKVQSETNALLVPPYDHPDIILGQGTTGKELEEQYLDLQHAKEHLNAVIAPIGGGGLLAGIATWFSDQETKVFGAEPSFQGADDAARGLREGKRIESVKTLTIADGLRTPVGVTNWAVVSDRNKVEGVYTVTEDQIKMAMRLVFERMKCVVEPSGCVSLAVLLFNREFRETVAREQEKAGGVEWDVGVVFSGGNTTMKAISALFGEKQDERGEEREDRVVENVAGLVTCPSPRTLSQHL